MMLGVRRLRLRDRLVIFFTHIATAAQCGCNRRTLFFAFLF